MSIENSRSNELAARYGHPIRQIRRAEQSYYLAPLEKQRRQLLDSFLDNYIDFNLKEPSNNPNALFEALTQDVQDFDLGMRIEIGGRAALMTETIGDYGVDEQKYRTIAQGRVASLEVTRHPQYSEEYTNGLLATFYNVSTEDYQPPLRVGRQSPYQLVLGIDNAIIVERYSDRQETSWPIDSALRTSLGYSGLRISRIEPENNSTRNS